MLDIKDLRDAVKNYFETNLPVFLSAEGVSNFEYYTSGQPKEEDKRECAFYPAGGTNVTSVNTESLLMLCQLYRVEDPIDYVQAIEKCWRAMDVEDIVGATDKEYDYETVPANTDEQSGNSSFIVWELTFRSENDDCEVT